MLRGVLTARVTLRAVIIVLMCFSMNPFDWGSVERMSLAQFGVSTDTGQFLWMKKAVRCC